MQQQGERMISPAMEYLADRAFPELAAAVRAALDGDAAEHARRLKRAGLAGQNAARGWFTNPANNWAPNTPGTIRRKGSSQPGIDTGAMRAAITFVVDNQGVAKKPQLNNEEEEERQSTGEATASEEIGEAAEAVAKAATEAAEIVGETVEGAADIALL